MTAAPPAVTSTKFLNRKFLNVPYMYWAAGFVAVLAFMAWRMKPSTASDDGGESGGGDFDDAGNYVGGGALAEQYPDMPTGTVVVAPNPVEQDNSLDNQSITDNETWLKRGVAFLVQRGEGAGEAQAALQTYLEGADMSNAQGVMRDAVIKELGLPPVAPSIGSTSSKPGRVQGPLPRYHKVEGNSDDTVAEIASLYYGRADANAKAKIKNPGVYKRAYGDTEPKFPIGTQIYVPAMTTPKVTAPTITNKKSVKPAPKPAPKRPLIKRGSKGTHVIYLQGKLGITRDGIFGPKTESAVRAFQRANRLTADGIVGPKTWAKVG